MKALNPFFSYFGSKFRLAKFYDPPKHQTLIEPFAGSAGYALLYPTRDVVLYDAYEPVVALWSYLIKVNESEILSLPLGPFSKENPIDGYDISREAQILIGFWATESQTSASRYPLSKSRGGNWTERKRARLAEQLQYIRHWKAVHASYADIPNQKATWYIDPPYELAGKRYRHNGIDYPALGQWCREREGQVIVCEQQPAAWLPFKELKRCRNASNKVYSEVVWVKDNN